jgi:hypothetical protein
MPPVPTTGFVLDVTTAGTALAAGLVAAAGAARILRVLLHGRRARAERAMRPMVLAVAAGADIPPGLTSARGEPGRAAERIVFAYLPQVRGEAAVSLAGVLARRGTVARILRRTRSPRAHKRARAAERLGLIASPEAELRLAELVTGDQSPEVRIVATRALGKTGSAAAARTLLHSLSRPSPVPEGVVASALPCSSTPRSRRTPDSGSSMPGGGCAGWPVPCCVTGRTGPKSPACAAGASPRSACPRGSAAPEPDNR